MSAIFISYRRADSGGHAGRLFDRLRHWFDDGEVFFDLDGIEAGETFPARLDDAVQVAQVVLVLIGPDWLATLQQRAARPSVDYPSVDYLRREVARALQLRAARGTPAVIPVLLGGAPVPDCEGLPGDLRAELADLGTLDVHEFRGKLDDWDNPFVRLRTLIAEVPGGPAPRFRAPAGTQQPFRVIDHSPSPHFQDPNGLLTQIRASLEGGTGTVVARVALFGMGGVGKTQLALKCSHEYRDAYAGVWWFRAETDATLQLGAWTPPQAAQFLAQRLPDGAAADRLALANDLGGLPLALEQAASDLEDTQSSVADYRKLLAGVDTGGLVLDEGRAATGYERNVAATLSLSFDRLSPAAARLLRLCAFAAPEPLPERFFREARDGLRDELAQAADSPMTWIRTIGELLRFGLANRIAIPALDRGSASAPDETEPALGFHRVTQQVVRARLARPAEDCAALQGILRRECPANVELPSNWPRLAVLSQHLAQRPGHADVDGQPRGDALANG